MKAFTVHAPDDDADPERIVFVKDGISWPALFIPVVWLLWRRLWVALALYLAYLVALVFLERAVGETAVTIVAILGAILFALEANNIRRWSLGRRGFGQIGETFGHNQDEAEIRYFHEHWGKPGATEREPWRHSSRAVPPDGTRKPDDDERVFGLFPRADA